VALHNPLFFRRLSFMLAACAVLAATARARAESCPSPDFGVCTTISDAAFQNHCLALRGQTIQLCNAAAAAQAALDADPGAKDESTRKKIGQFRDDQSAQKASLGAFEQETKQWSADHPDSAAAAQSAFSAVGGAELNEKVQILQTRIEALPSESLSPSRTAGVEPVAPLDGSGAQAASLLGVAAFKETAGAVLGAAPNAGVQRALQTLKSGQPAAAEAASTELLARNPNDAGALSVRAQSRAEQGNRAGALADARRALALNPNDKAAQTIVAQFEGQEQAQGRVSERLKGLSFGAAAEAGAPASSVGAPPSGLTGRALPANGTPGFGAGSRAQPAVGAAAGAAQAAAAAPFALRSLLETAASQLKVGDYSSALLTLERALDRDPRNASILDLIAKASNEAKNPLGAIAAADRALTLNPADAAALREKAYAELSLGQNEQALADIERAVRLEPQNGLGYLYRAMIEEKLARAADARRDYQAAQSLDPTLTPLAEAGLRRIGGDRSEGGRLPVSARALFRGGAIALSTVLIVLGLLGTATGRGWATKARSVLTPRAASAADESPAPSPATIGPGQFIGGHYRVVRELGRGGMGVVFQAFDETLRRPVAIKQLQREGRTEPQELERFLHEARLVAQLKHPHIAEIHAVVGGGDLLLVFEYVEGQSLDRLVGNGRRLPAAETRRLVSEIAGALDFAHARKIVHRDLKPSNVMVSTSGAAKVMDFGIAHQSRSGAAATRTTYVSGTPPYMSPEQMMGSVSPAADVYALAVMTYEMLTGRLPFDGPDYMEQKLSRRYAPATSVNPALPAALDALLARALEPDPTKRLSNAGDFSRGLAEAFGAAPSRV